MALARQLPIVSDRPAAKAGLRTERTLWPDRGPSVFEQELESIEDALLITTVEKAVAWAQSSSVWPDTFGLACCAIEMMSIVSSRYDISRFGMERFSSSPRQADLLIVSGRVVRYVAPEKVEERDTYTVKYVAQNLEGKRADGTLEVTVVPADDPNDAPEPLLTSSAPPLAVANTKSTNASPLTSPTVTARLSTVAAPMATLENVPLALK